MMYKLRLTAFVPGLLALTGCFGPGSKDIMVRGLELDEVSSVFVIVAPEQELGDADDPRTVNKLVDPERHGRFVSYSQYAPSPDRRTFQPRKLSPSTEKVEIAVSEKRPELEIEIDRDLLEPFPSLSAVVVVYCGARGWGACQRITAAQIKSSGSLEYNVRGPNVTLAGIDDSASLPTSLPLNVKP